MWKSSVLAAAVDLDPLDGPSEFLGRPDQVEGDLLLALAHEDLDLHVAVFQRREIDVLDVLEIDE